MKIHNTTNFPNHFLRRMVSWCCRELELPVRYVREARFRNRNHESTGCAYLLERRIVVSVILPIEAVQIVVTPSGTKVTEGQCVSTQCAAPEEIISRREEKRLMELIAITAHEIAHLAQYRDGSTTRSRGAKRVGGGSEARTMVLERQVVASFQANRGALLAAWSAPAPQRARDDEHKANQRSEYRKAYAALIRWERKLKLAKTKVSKYRARVRRYDMLAARKGDA